MDPWEIEQLNRLNAMMGMKQHGSQQAMLQAECHRRVQLDAAAKVEAEKQAAVAAKRAAAALEESRSKSLLLIEEG